MRWRLLLFLVLALPGMLNAQSVTHTSGGYCRLGGPCVLTVPIIVPFGSYDATAVQIGQDDVGLFGSADSVTLGAYDVGTGNQSLFQVQSNVSGNPKFRAYLWDGSRSKSTFFECIQEGGIDGCQLVVNDASNVSTTLWEPDGTTFSDPVNVPEGKAIGYQTGTSTLTGGAATEMLEFALASDAFVSGQVHTTTLCADATDDVKQRCEHDFICLNDGGTEGCDFTNATCTTNAEQGTSGTISATVVTADQGSGESIVEFNYQVTCSLTETTLETFWTVEFEKDGSWTAVTELN